MRARRSISIARRKIHVGIHFSRIAAQCVLDGALCLDKLAPIHRRQESQTADAVADRHLIGGLVLRLDLHELAVACQHHPVFPHLHDRDLSRGGFLPAGITPDVAQKNFIKAINKGLMKTFSKMGISTLQSYRGAQVFEAVGLKKELIEDYFKGTASRIEGIGLDVLASPRPN